MSDSFSGDIPRATTTESNGVVSCSVEETNRIRIALGLKPLQIEDSSSKKHREAIAPSVIQNRIEQSKRARQLRSDKGESSKRNDQTTDQSDKVTQSKYKSLGEALTASGAVKSSAADWVQASRSTKIPSKRSATRAKKIQQADTSSDHTTGLKIVHSAEEFDEGADNGIILTLKDKSLLDEDEDDELENVEMMASRKNELLQRRKERSKRPVYSAYDVANGSENRLLAQYDEEEDEQKLHQNARSIVTNDGRIVAIDSEEARKEAELVKERLAAVASKKKVDLSQSKFRHSREFKTNEEAEEELARMRAARDARKAAKRSKKRKLRKSKEIDQVEEESAPPSTASFIAELRATADTNLQNSEDRRSRKQTEGRTERIAREARQAQEQSTQKFQQAVSTAQKRFDTHVGTNDSVDELATTRRTVGTEKKLQEKGPSIKSSSKIDTVSGQRIYKWKDKNTAMEDETEEDTDLWQSVSRAARLSQKSQVNSDGDISMHNEQDESQTTATTTTTNNDNGAANVAAIVKQLQKKRQLEKQSEVQSETKNKMLRFTTTTEFSRRLQAQVTQNTEKETQEPISTVSKQQTSHNHNDEWDEASNEALQQASQKDESEEVDEISAASTTDQTGSGLREVAAGTGAAAALSFLRRSGELNPDPHVEFAGRVTDERPTWLGSKDDPAPDIKLEYRDEYGRLLTPKEAFRQLSYAFHGKVKTSRKREKTLRDFIETAATNSSASTTGRSGGNAILEAVHTAKAKAGRAFVTLDKSAQ